jgi:hypothetical protein
MRDPGLLLHALPILARTLSGDEPEERFVRVSRAEVLRRIGDEDRAA